MLFFSVFPVWHSFPLSFFSSFKIVSFFGPLTIYFMFFYLFLLSFIFISLLLFFVLLSFLHHLFSTLFISSCLTIYFFSLHFTVFHVLSFFISPLSLPAFLHYAFIPCVFFHHSLHFFVYLRLSFVPWHFSNVTCNYEPRQGERLVVSIHR